MKVDHKRDYVIGAYNLYDECERFNQLINEVRRNKRKIPVNWTNILLDSNWIHSDRPDWVNNNFKSIIEDTTVEDNGHYLDIHFSKRSYKRQHNFKRLSVEQRKKYFHSKGINDDKAIKNGNLNNSFIVHVPSDETVKELNKHRSILKWRHSIKMTLNKHKNMIENVECNNKFIFLYDVTPPYYCINNVLQDRHEEFRPYRSKKIMSLFIDYPAIIIWYLKNQDILTIFDPKTFPDSLINSWEDIPLEVIKPAEPFYNPYETYSKFLPAFQKEIGNYQDDGSDFLIEHV
ncbi:hypothetical protein [Lactobacillus helveticus]|uniref:hypothetical protein n=1 Tax=Lactobacillus helveticus TaxID=1587 RepID=UPI00197B70F9|nr:hypothetical protein [Lactobacillus helveticus]MBN6048414.1 hypothetical protein [Lactobacillus helveticus]